MVERKRLGRARWRMRGAWMWPAYLALTAADAVVLHLLPAQTDAAALGPSVLVAAVLNLALLALLVPPLGALLNRARSDLPRSVARDYAGTTLLGVGAAVVLALGFAHHGTVTRHHDARRSAAREASAFIRAHAPAEFRDNLARADTLTVIAGALYRTCAPSPARARAWCVLVRTGRDPPDVRYSSREPNASFGRGR